MPNLLAPIPASPGPSQVELDPSVYSFHEEAEEEQETVTYQESIHNSEPEEFLLVDQSLAVQDSIEAKIEESLAENVELPGTNWFP